jgi:hypothetical protein
MEKLMQLGTSLCAKAGNGTAVKATAGSIISFDNNQISANGTNGTFTSIMQLQ